MARTDEAGGRLSIHKRPSGGRGEYELVGRQGPRVASDFEGTTFLLDTPWGVKPANTTVSKQGGKNRLRLVNSRRGGHLPPQLAALLLMPAPTRDEASISRALPVLIDKRYIVDVDVELVNEHGASALIRPTTLITRSGDLDDDRLKEQMPFATRAAAVQLLHQRADDLPDGLSSLIRQHDRAVAGDQEVGDGVATLVRSIMAALDFYDAYYLPGTDPLPALQALAGLTPGDQVPVPEPPETPEDEPEVRLRAEHIYRLRRARGASATAFRREVQAAYDSRCVFCGLRAPLVAGRMDSGVDAAHILPWGAYDLDVVPNGLMLCKQHHWAFDNRVLRLDRERTSRIYRVSLVDDARALLSADTHTVEILEAVCGEVPNERLPRAADQRPSQVFLDEYNSLAFN